MKKFNKDLIEKLATGKIVIRFNSTKDSVDDLKTILKLAFPNDPNEAEGRSTYYYAKHYNMAYWAAAIYDTIFIQNKTKIVDLSEFILENEYKNEYKKGDKVYVSNDNISWFERIYVATIEEAIHPYYVVKPTFETETAFKNGEKVELFQYKYIKKQNYLELTIEQIAEAFNTSPERIKIIQ